MFNHNGHNAHNEKQGFMTHSGFTRRVTRPQGLKTLLFVVSVVSLWFELRFQG